MKSEGWLTHRILSNSNNLGDLAKPVHSGSSWHFCHYSFPSVTQQDTFHMRVLWTPLKGCMSDNYFGQTLHRKMKEGQRAFLATTSLSQFQSTLIRIPKHSAWLSCVWNPTCLIPDSNGLPPFNSCSTIRKMTRIFISCTKFSSWWWCDRFMIVPIS